MSFNFFNQNVAQPGAASGPPLGANGEESTSTRHRDFWVPTEIVAFLTNAF
jgi:hypothetical protein